MIATDVRVIDTDTHVVEPLDLWTLAAAEEVARRRSAHGVGRGVG